MTCLINERLVHEYVYGMHLEVWPQSPIPLGQMLASLSLDLSVLPLVAPYWSSKQVFEAVNVPRLGLNLESLVIPPDIDIRIRLGLID